MVFKILGRRYDATHLFVSPGSKGPAQEICSISQRKARGNHDCSLLRAVVLSTASATLLTGFAQLGVFQILELKAFDRLTQLTTEPPFKGSLKNDENNGQNNQPANALHTTEPAANSPIVIVMPDPADNTDLTNGRTTGD